MKRAINWEKATYKEWIGLSASPVFWFASLICFVLGLQFKSDTLILLPGIGIDLTTLFSIGLGLANTAIQIVGNDSEREELGMALWLMWIASYMLGIGSNVNFLYSKIALSSPILQFLVCWGLGTMIEVAPERLLVKFLRKIGVFGEKLNEQPKQELRQSKEERHQEYRKQYPQPQVTANQVHSPKYQDGYGGEGGRDLPQFIKNHKNGENLRRKQ